MHYRIWCRMLTIALLFPHWSHIYRRLTKGVRVGGSPGKELACNPGDLSSIPGLGRSSGGGHGDPLQYSCLENPHGQRSLVGCSPWGLKESDMTERLSIAQQREQTKFLADKALHLASNNLLKRWQMHWNYFLISN